MKRAIQITVETERVIEVAGDDSSAEWCASCDAPTPLLSVEQAAVMACLGAGVIRHWIGNAEFHCQPSRAGLPRICQRSFLAHLKRLNFLPKPRRGAETF